MDMYTHTYTYINLFKKKFRVKKQIRIAIFI